MARDGRRVTRDYIADKENPRIKFTFYNHYTVDHWVKLEREMDTLLNTIMSTMQKVETSN